MSVEIVTGGERLGSSNPWRRKYFVEAYDHEGEPIELEELVRILEKAEKMLTEWVVVVPKPIPWYHVRSCKYCEKIVKQRYERRKVMFYDWWYQFCHRHAVAEFINEIDVYDNKERRFEIDLEKGRVVANVCTCRHSATYSITSLEIVAELDGKYRFRYRPHKNSWPFEPAFNTIVRRMILLVHELRDILQYPPKLQLYFNGELIHHP